MPPVSATFSRTDPTTPSCQKQSVASTQQSSSRWTRAIRSIQPNSQTLHSLPCGLREGMLSSNPCIRCGLRMHSMYFWHVVSCFTCRKVLYEAKKKIHIRPRKDIGFLTLMRNKTQRSSFQDKRQQHQTRHKRCLTVVIEIQSRDRARAVLRSPVQCSIYLAEI